MPDVARHPSWSRLRPGAPVLLRDAGLLQVGLDPPSLALLADTPAVRALLARLRTGCPEPALGPGADPDQVTAWQRLHQALLLVPDPGGETGASGPGTFTATAAWAGPRAAERLAARSSTLVRVVGPAALVEPVTRLGVIGGLRIDAADGSPQGDEPGLVVVLHEGEARRRQHDDLQAAGLPHLPVWWRGGLPHVGPLVVPGVTACLRCLDAQESEADPRRPLLVEQAGREPAPPHDPVLLALAVAWTVREAQRWAEGATPTSWSATVRLGPDGPPEVTRWARHPYCGCAWDAPAA
ncbi:hypothetical protein [Nocardioides sp. AX2bis]|uniref:hypothetical protein n=1 Tax=Nocardioides sp. AX2bis TaxID=2653157 RepID=UPI0012EFBE71|nr:hypothetical protein [Nocardioides sp. AX2bis]VXB14499.1 Bacteriocin biosynthesis cyclodehydratase domain-containing protein [Nocardioides sp. AX2bis]